MISMTKHLLSVDDLDLTELERLFTKTAQLKATDHWGEELAQKTICTVFYESSTRTRLSFELAAKRLGATAISFESKGSSVEKGESLTETVSTLQALGTNLLCLRHPSSDASQNLAKAKPWKLSLVSAGEGTREHPTQALLDAFTLYEVVGGLSKLAGKKLLIVGDITNSRVAKSNIKLLTRLGVKIRLCAPPVFLPDYLSEGSGLELETDLDLALKNIDFVLVLRPQRERGSFGQTSGEAEYAKYYQVNRKRLEAARMDLSKAFLLHPGPVNAGFELSAELIYDPCSLIERQVSNGLYLRMALMLQIILV